MQCLLVLPTAKPYTTAKSALFAALAASASVQEGPCGHRGTDVVERFRDDRVVGAAGVIIGVGRIALLRRSNRGGLVFPAHIDRVAAPLRAAFRWLSEHNPHYAAFTLDSINKGLSSYETEPGTTVDDFLVPEAVWSKIVQDSAAASATDVDPSFSAFHQDE